MINANIKVVRDEITPALKKMREEIKKLPQRSLTKFKELTPIDKGNARRKTRLQGTDKIVADYPYAQRLDEGWSKQAPKGMTEPFEKWFQQETDKIFRNK
jgi:hypothetical protein